MILDFLLVERDRNVPPIGLCSINNYCKISPMTDSRDFPIPTSPNGEISRTFSETCLDWFELVRSYNCKSKTEGG